MSNELIVTNPVLYKNGLYSWFREGQYMVITYPLGQPFEMPAGFHVDRTQMPQNIEGASFSISNSMRRVKVPVLGWGLPNLRPYTERVFFAKDVSDSHNGFYNGKFTIPVTGEYIYQIIGLPIAKSRFLAGAEINHDLNFLFLAKAE